VGGIQHEIKKDGRRSFQFMESFYTLHYNIILINCFKELFTKPYICFKVACAYGNVAKTDKADLLAAYSRLALNRKQNGNSKVLHHSINWLAPAVFVA